MSNPRRIVAGQTLFVTRRCWDRRFYLLPAPELNEAFRYLLAECKRRYGVEVHGFVLMGNHYHLHLTDVFGKLPLFMHRLDFLLARYLKALRKIRGSVFEAGSYHMLPLEDEGAVLDKLAYLCMNPVSARLVKQPYQWQGALSLPEHLGTVVDTHLTRPKVYFRPRPNEKPLTLTLTLPPVLCAMGRDAVVDAVQQRIHQLQSTLTGPALGMRRVLRSRFTDRPHTPETPGAKVPVVAASSPSIYRQALQRLQEFYRAYRLALDRFRRFGDTSAFPEGTWLWRLHHYGHLPPPACA